MNHRPSYSSLSLYLSSLSYLDKAVREVGT